MDATANGVETRGLEFPATPVRRSRSPSHNATLRKTATPPPSSQIYLDRHDEQMDGAGPLPQTPTTTRRNALKDLPSQSHIESASTDELRSMVKTLSADLADSRINAANAHLQHQFLVLETSQAAERAEIERQLSRTQVDYLRGKQRIHNIKLPSISSSAVQLPTPLEGVSHSMRELESHCFALEELCDRLKREKEVQAERIQSLSEHNSLLVNRIRENREHFTRLRDRSPVMYTPRDVYTTPRRKTYARYQDDTPAHGPFAALIAADQILSQETASVPSTPTRRATGRAKGHTRGAHSLSSITTPQARDRPGTSDAFLGPQLMFSAPSSQVANESALREHHERDSTISMSDDDQPNDSGEIGQSQASSLATNMLRKNPTAFEGSHPSQDVEQSSSLLQSKLFGNVSKSSDEQSAAKLKRAYGFTDTVSRSKKIRAADNQVGLGIEA